LYKAERRRWVSARTEPLSRTAKAKSDHHESRSIPSQAIGQPAFGIVDYIGIFDDVARAFDFDEKAVQQPRVDRDFRLDARSSP
jgi:hypothetical protein